MDSKDEFVDVIEDCTGMASLVSENCMVLADPEDTPQLYSDEILNARLSLYTRRHLPWVSVLMGWILFLSIGRGIELWSGLFFGVLAISSLIIPVLHIMGKTRFLAELAKITP